MQPFDYFARRLSPNNQAPRTGISGWLANLIYRACLFFSSSLTRQDELTAFLARLRGPLLETAIDTAITINEQRTAPTASRIRSNTSTSLTSEIQILDTHYPFEIHNILHNAIDEGNVGLITDICSMQEIPIDERISIIEGHRNEPLLAYIKQALDSKKYASLTAIFAQKPDLANLTLPFSDELPLDWAIAHEDNTALEIILTAGAPLRDPMCSTQLIAAIKKNNPAIVTTLLKHNADPNEVFYLDPTTTPLQHAVKIGHPEIVCTLLEYGACDNTAFLQAVQEGKFEIARVWINFAKEKNTLKDILASTDADGKNLLQVVEALKPSENLTGEAILSFMQSFQPYRDLLPEAPLKDEEKYASFVKKLSPAVPVHSHLNSPMQRHTK